KEKTSLRQAGFPTTPFQAVENLEQVHQAGELLGWPLVLKTTRSGYDGKGQMIVRTVDDAAKAWDLLETNSAIAEQWIDFDAEVSMVTARNAHGQVECYPLFENDHTNHVLDITRCPVSTHLRHFEEQATEICHGIATNFGVLGLFCVEFFVSGSGKLMINEIAPRPHNSGHLTIEAFTCSQFEQQVRAICNLPLVPPAMLRPAAMANLMGDLWQAGPPNWQTVLAEPAAHLHLYGKAEARAGRKMGHLTVLDESSSEAAITAKELREALVRAT
ncbi:MAG: ATP-grasp domain-containing protein, partial [Aureliella sp.]